MALFSVTAPRVAICPPAATVIEELVSVALAKFTSSVPPLTVIAPVPSTPLPVTSRMPFETVAPPVKALAELLTVSRPAPVLLMLLPTLLSVSKAPSVSPPPPTLISPLAASFTVKVKAVPAPVTGIVTA